MTILKRRKNSRQRGTHTHGWGSKKKHRGAGSRGGHGGTGKRGDSLKPSVWKNKKYFGKHGFKHNNAIKIDSINIGDIQNTILTLVKRGLAEGKSGSYSLNLLDLGYNKLLGKGKVKDKFQIKAVYATPKAIDKVEKAGGKVDIKISKPKKSPKQVEEPKAEKSSEKPATPVEKNVEKPKETGIKSPQDIIKEVKGQ